MDHVLWNKIREFDLDAPFSEYGFSTRLADENYWTKYFTVKAIVEYKKFMYLAVTSELMVSPSEIIDTVWHQHLIYTQSYSDFCDLIGKNVQHIPSTHNKVDAEKFRLAKERTKKLYTESFGEQPKEIWNYSGMYESLELEKANWKIRSFILVGLFAFAGLSIPFYFLLKPLYVQIDNPEFIQLWLIIALTTIILLELYNRKYLLKTVQQFHKSSFIHDLTAQELIYLKTQRIHDVVHLTMNQLVEQNKVFVHEDHTIEKNNYSNPSNLEEFQVFEVNDFFRKTTYLNILRSLVQKPIFSNIRDSMEALKKYFTKSKRFGRLFYLNFSVLGFLLLLLFIRFSSGLLRDKPIVYVTVTLIIFSFISAVFLIRLTNITTSTIIPNFYKQQVLPVRKIDGDVQWQYFLIGSAVLATSFIPTMQHANRQYASSDGGGTSSSCTSSCGSSCSSCGGCGGGD